MRSSGLANTKSTNLSSSFIPAQLESNPFTCTYQSELYSSICGTAAWTLVASLRTPVSLWEGLHCCKEIDR